MSVRKTNKTLFDFLSRSVENVELMTKNDVVTVYPSFADMDENAEVHVPSLTYLRVGSTTNLYFNSSQNYANIQYEVVISAEWYDDLTTIEDSIIDTAMNEPDVIGVTGGTDAREADTNVWVRSLLVQMHELT